MEFEQGKIVPVNLEHEMKNCYIDYAMSVIVARALPDVRDGLKPVQRRMLYQLYTIYGKKHVRISVLMGDLLKLHPHGDQGLGDTIARLCQTFSNNIPLIETEGNAGTLAGGDDAAAARYLDITLSDFAAKALFDVEKDV